MAERLKVEWAVQNAAILDALKKVSASLDKAEKSAQKHAAQSKRGGQQATSSMQKLGMSIVSMGASYIGATQLAAAFTEELRAQERIQLRQAQAGQSVESAIALSAKNFGEDTIGLRAFAAEKAPELGTTMEGLIKVMGDAISAGAKSRDEAFKVSQAALKLEAGNAEAAGALIQGTLDLAGFQGTTDFEGVMGQLVQFMQVARGIDSSQFIRNVRPGLAAAAGGGFNIDAVSNERALEFAAFFSKAIGDEGGSVVKTTLTNFFSRLDEFVPEEKKKLKDKTESRLTKADIAKFQGERDVDRRSSQLMANPAMMRQFLDTLERGPTKQAITTFLLDKRPELDATVKETITDLKGSAEAFTTLTAIVQAETEDLRSQRASVEGQRAIDVMGQGATRGTARGAFNLALTGELPGFDLATRELAKAELEARRERAKTASK